MSANVPPRPACAVAGLVAGRRACENRRDQRQSSEDHPMDKKAKTPKKPKQNKGKDAAKAK
jgi:hypothetical protein